MNRIDRLTAILIHLQTKRVVKAEEISTRFEISLRTVYRDVKALMEAGVPIGSEAGKGYFIVDGFHLPPVMFTQDEASAMLLAGKLVNKMADKSVRTAFDSALYKIKAVLNEAEKDHLANLDSHIEVFFRSRYEQRDAGEFPNHFLTEIQRALGKRQVLRLDYSDASGTVSQRDVEPVGIFYYSLAWHLIGWCRLRNGYRNFRSDRIKALANTGESFATRSELSLKEYFQGMYQNNPNLIPATVLFNKAEIRGQQIYGSIAQHDLGDSVRCEFLLDNLDYMAQWLMPFGKGATVEAPIELRHKVAQRAAEVYAHYQESQPVA